MLMTIYFKKYSYKIIGMYEKYAELRWKELSWMIIELQEHFSIIFQMFHL